MEEEEPQDKYLQFIRSNILIFGVLIGGIVLISIGLIELQGQKQTSIEFERGTDISNSTDEKIIVDVAGGVVSPGVYTLKSGTRIKDALDAAGGLSEDADQEYIAKSINLAENISDGTKIYIPKVGEDTRAEAIVAGSDTTNSGVVSINSASSTELESLPGIGPVTAGKITDGRPYTSIEELKTRQILGEKTYEKISDLVSL